MSNAYLWYGLFMLLLFGYAIIQLTVKAKKRYFLYFISGCVLGFYSDIVSFVNGYYSYPDFYRFTILGLPFSMTLAEGFSAAITIYLYELIKKFIKKHIESRPVTAKNML